MHHCLYIHVIVLICISPRRVAHCIGARGGTVTDTSIHVDILFHDMLYDTASDPEIELLPLIYKYFSFIINVVCWKWKHNFQ